MQFKRRLAVFIVAGGTKIGLVHVTMRATIIFEEVHIVYST